MWILIILAVHTNDPQDVPGRVEIEMPSLAACQAAAESIRWELKFRSFRVEAKCEQK